MVQIPSPHQFWIRIGGPQFKDDDVPTEYILEAIHCKWKCVILEAHQFVVAICRVCVVWSLKIFKYIYYLSLKQY